jgi:hypothetical protein
VKTTNYGGILNRRKATEEGGRVSNCFMDRREGEVCKRARVLRGTSDGGGWEELCVEKEVGVKRVEEGRKEEGESNEREGGREGRGDWRTD